MPRFPGQPRQITAEESDPILRQQQAGAGYPDLCKGIETARCTTSQRLTVVSQSPYLRGNDIMKKSLYTALGLAIALAFSAPVLATSSTTASAATRHHHVKHHMKHHRHHAKHHRHHAKKM
jgi:hypothetical protein